MLTKIEIDRPLTRFPESGDSWRWNRVSRTEANEALYNGDFSSLTQGRTKTARNGLAQIDALQDYIVSNWFRRLSRYRVAALTSRRPPITSENEARNATLELSGQNDPVPQFWAAIRMGQLYKSQGGYMVIVVNNSGRVSAIRSRYTFPVTNPFDDTDIQGWVFAYPYNPDRTISLPSRIRIVEWGVAGGPYDGVNNVRDYAFDGYTIQGTPTIEPADLVGVWVYGDGDDDYSEVKAIAAEGMVLQTLIAHATHRHLNPGFAGPAAYMQSLLATGSTEQEKRTASGLVIPVDVNDPPPEFFSADVDIAGALEELKWFADEFYRQTGVSPVVDGFGGQATSGAGFDRLMFTGTARIADDREAVDAMASEVLDAMGVPVGDTSIAWIADVFSSVAERNAQALELYNADVITRTEIRARFDYQPLPEDEEDGNQEANRPEQVQEALGTENAA